MDSEWNSRLAAFAGRLDSLSGIESRLQSALDQQKAELGQTLDDYQAGVAQGANDIHALATGMEDIRALLEDVKTVVAQNHNAVKTPVAVPTAAAPGHTGPAMLVPGGNGGYTWLPVDARYPADIYDRLVRARSSGDAVALAQVETELEQSLRDWAKSMRDCYAGLPDTVGFSLLFLPVEGLCAEVLRRPALCRDLHRDYRVVIAGPSTIEFLLADTARRAEARNT